MRCTVLAARAVWERLDERVVAPVMNQIEERAKHELERDAYDAIDGCVQRGDDLHDPGTAKWLKDYMLLSSS